MEQIEVINGKHNMSFDINDDRRKDCLHCNHSLRLCKGGDFQCTKHLFIIKSIRSHTCEDWELYIAYIKQGLTESDFHSI